MYSKDEDSSSVYPNVLCFVFSSSQGLLTAHASLSTRRCGQLPSAFLGHRRLISAVAEDVAIQLKGQREPWPFGRLSPEGQRGRGGRVQAKAFYRGPLPLKNAQLPIFLPTFLITFTETVVP